MQPLINRLHTNSLVLVALLCLLFSGGALAQRKPQVITTVADLGDTVIRVDSVAPEKVYDGYLFWHQADEIATDVVNYTMLLNAAGELVHRWDNDLSGGGHTAYLLESGGLLRMGVRDRTYLRGQPIVGTDILQITDSNGEAIWELDARDIDLGGNKVTFHHDSLPMPDGNILVLIYEEISPRDALANGWSAGEGKPVWSDGVLEIKPDYGDGSHDLVWQWRFIDHIIQDRDRNAPNYGVIAEHPERIDAHFPKSYAPTNSVRQHINSIDYNPELDQILLSSFIYDEIWVVDHGTTKKEASGSTGGRSGKGGDLLFRYGNPAAYDRGTDDDRVFRKQHDANWVDAGFPGAGNILVFNNNTDLRGLGPGPGGAGADPGGWGGTAAAIAQEQLKGISNVHEIRPAINALGEYQRNNGQGFEAERVWYWEDKDFFAPFQGGARRLPNGNTLLSDTVKRRVWEVAREGDVVVRYAGPAPTFKSFKYSRDRIGHLIGK